MYGLLCTKMSAATVYYLEQEENRAISLSSKLLEGCDKPPFSSA